MLEIFYPVAHIYLVLYCGPSEGFNIILSSEFETEDAAEFLIGQLPLDKCQILNVVDGSPPKPWVPEYGDVVRMGEDIVQIMKVEDVGKDETDLVTTVNATANVKQKNGKVKMVVKLSELRKADAGVEFKLDNVSVAESADEPKTEPESQVKKSNEAKGKKTKKKRKKVAKKKIKAKPSKLAREKRKLDIT